MQTYSEFHPSGFDTRGLGLPEQQDWFVLPCGRNRDSEALTRSNFRVAEKMLAKIDPEGVDHEVHRFGHWACGWFEIIIVRPDTVAAKEAERIEAKLADYPILDEHDFSDLEQEDADLTWRNCYNDKQRLEYIKEHWSQFEHCHAKWYPANEAWRNLLDCVRGRAFYGYASELLA